MIAVEHAFSDREEVAVPDGAARCAIHGPRFAGGFLPIGVASGPSRRVDPRTSNQLALIIGPEITTPLPISVARDGAGTATLTLEFQPHARPGQQVSLLLGTREVLAQPFISGHGHVELCCRRGATRRALGSAAGRRH